MALTDLSEAAIQEAVDTLQIQWVDAATKTFADFGFVLERGWWKHDESGLYAAVDDVRMGVGCVAAVYAHRVDPLGTDYMQGLVTVPWYGQGADMRTAQRLLKSGIITVLGL